MLHRVKDLRPEQKNAVETLLGRPVSEDDSISIRAVTGSPIVPSRLTEADRARAKEQLHAYFAHVDAHRRDVSEEEETAIIDEALRSVRPGYRPID